MLARDAVRRAPKAIEDLDSQLWRLSHTAKQVVDEPALQIKPIHDGLEEIYNIALELKATVEKMRKLQRRSRASQLLHALVLGQRDEAALRDILGRLRDAQDTLGTRISVAHVRSTTGVAKTVDRIEVGVESIRKDIKRQDDIPQLDISNNVADGAKQENSVDVWDGVRLPTAWIRDNQAWNGSWQRNVISIGGSAIRCAG
jgi:hypothetical protein